MTAAATDLTARLDPERTVPPMRIFSDTWLMFRRSLGLTFRQPAWLIAGVVQPFVYLLLFGPLLNSFSGMPGFPPGGAFNVFVPGLLVMTALFGSTFVGFGFIDEMRHGVVERMRVTPMSRTATVLGRSLRDVVVFLLQGLILVVLAIPFGLTINPLGFVVAFGLLALIGLMLGPISYAMALVIGSEDALAPLTQAIALPLLLLSGVMLPMSLAPEWLRTIASFNPLYHATLAIRALFNAEFSSPDVVTGIVTTGAFALLSIFVASRAFNRQTA
jgi:ABC-2 type transport system permease protein